MECGQHNGDAQGMLDIEHTAYWQPSSLGSHELFFYISGCFNEQTINWNGRPLMLLQTGMSDIVLMLVPWYGV